jgi:hypothetical protein
MAQQPVPVQQPVPAQQPAPTALATESSSTPAPPKTKILTIGSSTLSTKAEQQSEHADKKDEPPPRDTRPPNKADQNVRAMDSDAVAEELEAGIDQETLESVFGKVHIH